MLLCLCAVMLFMAGTRDMFTSYRNDPPMVSLFIGWCVSLAIIEIVLGVFAIYIWWHS